MGLKIQIPETKNLLPKITIFGVGGAGGNAVNNMIKAKLEGVEFVAANTDAQSLEKSLAENKIQLGLEVTKGLGAGSFPDHGKMAAEENIDEIKKLLEGNHMIFIAAGMGGGTGTGAAPVIARLAKEQNILTVAVITKPFHFEGKHRMDIAQKGIEELKKQVDTLIVIPNQNLFRIANEKTTFESAFKMADDVLHAGVRGITDLITMPGLVNLDFADIKTVMTKMGKAMMGTGEAEGENRAIEACEAAIANPLLDDVSIRGARGVLVNMTGGPDMTLFEADLAVNTIRREVDEDANIIFGSAFDDSMKGKIRVSVVATGIDEEEFMQNSLINNTAKQTTTKFKEEHKIIQTESSNAVKTAFFDPGAAKTIEENAIEEISSSDFKSKKEFLDQENPNYGKSEHNPSQEKSAFSQISFFNDEKEEDDDFDKIEDIKKTEPKNTKKAPKKDNNNSGFSLFSFMSSLKTEEDDEEDSRNNQQESRQEKPSSSEIAKKKEEFFGNTILEDDKEKSSNLNEDILNVPAFFRKKNK
jgi:cell division protein FtsZ